MPLQFRIRTREDTVDVSGFVTVRDSGGSIYSETGTVTQRSTHRGEFHDWVGGRKMVHPADHNTILHTQVSRPNHVHVPSGWSSQFVRYYYPRHNADVLHELFGFPTAAQRTALADQAFEALVPQIPQEVSLPNFLYELRELADLIPKIEGSLVKQVAGGYLTYSFGYKPLIGDLQKLANLAETVAARLQYLRDTWGRETRISFESSWETEAPDEIYYPGSESQRYRRHSIRTVFRAGGYLFHQLEDLDGKIGLLRGMSGALGFNNPLGVLWEAIPFSFVVDWFTRIGNAISQTAVQPFVGPWEIRRVTHSYWIHGQWSLDCEFPSGTSPLKYTADQGTYTLYRREVGLPVPAGIINTEGLTSNQQTLAAALIGSSLP